MSSTVVSNFIPRGRFLVAEGFPDGPRITGVSRGYELSDNTIRHRMTFPHEFDDVFFTSTGKKYNIRIIARFRRREHAVAFIRNMEEGRIGDIVKDVIIKVTDSIATILFNELTTIQNQINNIKNSIDNRTCGNPDANDPSEAALQDDPEASKYLRVDGVPSRCSSLP